ncbi:MAG: HlyD family efflux transporter periplasmic adaptor subunit [Saprospiraceae bacterium]|nr:HlyD family efflux transporter periplasmic adaptor subunit [Saprospiraceae bacterium]
MSKPLIQDPEAIRLNEEEEVQQLLGNPPGWMLRWGITMVFIAFVILVIFSNFFRYPDRVSAPVTLTSERPPVKIFALERGRIEALKVSDQEQVLAGQLLAVIENPANSEDVETLDVWLRDMELSQFSNFINLEEEEEEDQALEASINLPASAPEAGLQLGPIQTFYAELLQQIDLQRYTLNRDANYKGVSVLRNQIRNTREMNRNIIDQIFLLEREVHMAEKNEERLRKLLENGAESQINVEAAIAATLAKKRELKTKKSAQITNKLEIDRLKKEIITLEKEQSDDVASGKFNIQAKLKEVRGAIDEWKLKYTLVTPIDGQVSFSKIWSPHQFVQPDELVMTIVPYEGQGMIIARGALPVARSGKVDSGMVVNIRLDNYPYKEYGIVKGSVTNIAPVPNPGEDTEPIYQLTVGGFDTPSEGKLNTTYNQLLDFQQEMAGIALVITEDRNLWQRLVTDRFRNVKYNR